MWLAHGRAASSPGGRSRQLLRSMLAVSACVYFVGGLTGREGCPGAAVWMTSQQVLQGGLPAQGHETHEPAHRGLFSASHPLCPAPTSTLGAASFGSHWALCPSRGVEELENGKRFYSPSKIKSKWYLQFQKFLKKKKILSIRGIRELYTMAEMMYTSTGLMYISVYEFVRTHWMYT